MEESPALRKPAAPRSKPEDGRDAERWPRRFGRLAAGAGAVLGRVSLFQRFALVSLLILVVGAYVIGSYVAGEIKGRVINRTSALTALYVDSFVSPHLQELKTQDYVSPDHLEQLDGLLRTTSLGEKIVSFKIWHYDGEIAYASERALVGQRFPIAANLQKALNGEIQTGISNLQEDENIYERGRWGRLLETYAPVHSNETGEIIGVSEFYQDASDLESAISGSQRKGWLIVGSATGVMYLLLVGMVRGAGTTISRQHRRLEELARRNADLARRVRQAAAKKSETDERLMMRIAQDLHDGPAQDVSLALLRLQSIAQGEEPTVAEGGGEADLQLMRTALNAALKEIREISAGLRLPDMNPLSLAEVVRRAVQEHQDKTGTTVKLTPAPVMPPADLALKIVVYRVIQEALNNAYVHGGGREPQVSVACLEGIVRLEVRDGGDGLSASPPPDAAGGRRPHLGLRGMRERVEMLGGLLEITSQPERGTTVQAKIPLSGEEIS